MLGRIALSSNIARAQLGLNKVIIVLDAIYV